MRDQEQNEPYAALLDRMARALPNLTPQVQKIAAYILDNPGSVATLSMRTLAADAQVPPSTLPRLAKALNYRSYEAYRDVFRSHVQGQTVGYAEQAGQLQRLSGADDSDALMSAFQQASLHNVQHLFATLDFSVLEEIAQRLRSARKVYVVGMQASFAASSYFHYVGKMAYDNWVLMDSRYGELTEHAADMCEDDVLIAIAMPPCSRESIGIVEFARMRRAAVIGITNTRTSPLATRADKILIVATQSPQFFESFVTTILLLEIVLGLVVAGSGQDVLSNIERGEACRRILGEYWEGT